MALSAHAVPVLGGIGPVQPVIGFYRSFRRYAVPFVVSRVPGDVQRLQAAAGEGNQVLLQGVPAEGVGDLEVAHLTTGAIGVDKEFAVFPVEA